MVTADALYCQTAFARTVLDQGAGYLLCVEGNQGTLHQDIVGAFADPATVWTRAITVERQHQRWEEGSVRATIELNEHIGGYPAVGQVLKISRTVHDTRGEHHDVDYFITSLTPRQADASRLLILIRGHWSIETRHYLRDVVFGEYRPRFGRDALPRAWWS